MRIKESYVYIYGSEISYIIISEEFFRNQNMS